MAHIHAYDHESRDTHGQTPGACGAAEPGGPAMHSSRDGRIFGLSGVDCAEAVAIPKKAVGPVLAGEEGLVCDVLNGRVAVREGTSAPSTDAILKAVATTGMGATP